MSLLIAGGQNDPNLSRLGLACRSLAIEHTWCLHGCGTSPVFEWLSHNNQVRINEVLTEPTAAFIRYDVFEGIADARDSVQQRAISWYQAINGWLLATPTIGMFNRRQLPVATNKLSMLRIAEQIGLKVPTTIATNFEPTIRSSAAQGFVTKPVEGGDYCRELSGVLSGTEFRDSRSACPAFVQPRLIQPEIRIYVIGGEALAFGMQSSSLDYRVEQDANVTLLDHLPTEHQLLRELMNVVGLDYAAADFKTDSTDGSLNFLEINTSPMFAQFDIVSGGRLCETMIRHLI